LSTPLTAAFLAEDADDRRTALEVAAAMFDDGSFLPPRHSHANNVLHIADEFYAWLRARPTVQVASVTLTAGPVTEQGVSPHD
jgi:hypothetical protein